MNPHGFLMEEQNQKEQRSRQNREREAVLESCDTEHCFDPIYLYHPAGNAAPRAQQGQEGRAGAVQLRSPWEQHQ